jgi:glutamine synthetase
MDFRDGSMGRASFVARHGLWTGEDREAASRAAALIGEHELHSVRFSFADQHGVLRGKSVNAAEAPLAMQSGVTMTTTLLAKDTAHRTVYPAFTEGGGFGMAEMEGAGDFVMVADPKTFRVLPWAQGTGWVLCDIYFPDGRPVPFATRAIARAAMERLAAAGYDYVSGLEVEFHLYKLLDPRLGPEHATQPASPPEVALLAHGFQYLTEQRLDELEPALEILRRDLTALGLAPRTMEVEFGPSQVEVTFDPAPGIESADRMVLFRSAVKQIARRNGLHASFMCRPNLPNAFASGWHLHQSLRDANTGANAFMADGGGDAPLSSVGMAFVGGLLAHAAEACVFTTPTINGYKRYQPYSLAPDRAIWGRDNRGVMLRVLGAANDPGSRVENRIGEPAANPYLYLASQAVAGLAGIEGNMDPGPSADVPYETAAPKLPKSLIEAVAALRDSALFRTAFGDSFVDYIVHIKEAEIARFLASVTDWEQREYFEIF